MPAGPGAEVDVAGGSAIGSGDCVCDSVRFRGGSVVVLVVDWVAGVHR